MEKHLKWRTYWKHQQVGMPFLNNFSILVGMLLGPIDLIESNKYIMRANSSFSVGLGKMNFEFYFSESMKIIFENI